MKHCIQLIHAIWDSITADTDYPELTDAEKQEFDRRIAEHDADNILTWEELKASIQFSKTKTQQLTHRAEIDAALIEMSTDPDYHADVTQLEAEFAPAQWEALHMETLHQ